MRNCQSEIATQMTMMPFPPLVVVGLRGVSGSRPPSTHPVTVPSCDRFVLPGHWSLGIRYSVFQSGVSAMKELEH